MSSAEVPGNNNSISASVSADGRFVVFDSIANNLVSSDPSYFDVFLRDRQLGTTTRVSVTPLGGAANGNSREPAISADGRYVAFESDASNLVTGDSNSRTDIFIRDLQTGQTERVSYASDGSQSNDYSWYATLSDDGRYVGFESQATNLVPGDTNAMIDLFVRDRALGQTVRVSVPTEGTQANGRSEAADLSADGRYVAFDSAATNLVPVYSNLNHVYLRDLVAGTTTRISVTPDGTVGNGASQYASLSPDARYVAFQSGATNLVPGDTNYTADVFLLDRGADPNQIIPLALDEAHTERLSSGQTTLYSIDVDAAEGVLLVQLRPLSGINALDLSARLGMVVLVGRYDQRVLYPNADGIYELVIDPTVADAYYLCVKGTDVVPVGGFYEIEAQLVVRHLSEFSSPAPPGNAGTTTLNIRGAGLDQAVAVRLQGSGLPTLVGADLTVASPTELWAASTSRVSRRAPTTSRWPSPMTRY